MISEPNVEEDLLESVHQTQDLAFHLFKGIRFTLLILFFSIGILIILILGLLFFPQILNKITLFILSGVLFLFISLAISFQNKEKKQADQIKLHLSNLILQFKKDKPQTCGSMDHRQTRARK